MGFNSQLQILEGHSETKILGARSSSDLIAAAELAVVVCDARGTDSTHEVLGLGELDPRLGLSSAERPNALLQLEVSHLALDDRGDARGRLLDALGSCPGCVVQSLGSLRG